MKNKVTIKNSNDEILQFVYFYDETTQNNWIDYLATSQVWGSDYSVTIEDATVELEQAAINAEAKAYLASTDYLIIRELDNGEPCPAEIKAERQAARNRIQ